MPLILTCRVAWLWPLRRLEAAIEHPINELIGARLLDVEVVGGDPEKTTVEQDHDEQDRRAFERVNGVAGDGGDGALRVAHAVTPWVKTGLAFTNPG